MTIRPVLVGDLLTLLGTPRQRCPGSSQRSSGRGGEEGVGGGGVRVRGEEEGGADATAQETARIAREVSLQTTDFSGGGKV